MSLKFPFQRTKSNTFIPDSDESTSTSSKLQAQLKLTRKSISEATHPILPAIHTSSGKKKKKNRKLSSAFEAMDPAALLLKAALDQPFLEQAIIPLHLFTPNVENLKIEDDQLDCWFTNVEECLKELETCQCSIVEQSKELTTMLSRFELGSLSGMSDKNYCITNADLSPIAFNHFKNLKDRLSLFSITCQAMADTAAEFVLLAAETHHSKQHPAPHEEHETEVNSLNPVSEDWENEQEEYFDALDLGPVGEEIGFQERREEDMLEKSLPTNISNGFLTHQHKPVQQRRKRVPFRPISSINYLSLMKNCIGKDLSKMAMPVDFNEPLSALQRATEELEYSNLLDSAALETSDSCRRLALVAVFAVSTYSTTGTRTTKPFNPLLAETYECDRKIDKGWRSLAEQVSHHPPTSALYAESQGWTFNQCYTITTKIKGRSLCVMPVGSTYVRFLDNDDVFVYDKVCTSSTMTNIVSGKLQTENCGDFLVFNSSTGDKCLLKFHEQGGIFSREVPKSGTVIDASGRPRYRIEAIWDQYANLYRLDSNQQARSEETVWMVDPLPINSAKMHNFTEFAIELNQPEAGVAPTDSRNRPDQRLMEQGIDWTTANAIKQQLEEAQRVRRRLAADKKHRPLWFVEKREEEMLDKNDVYAFTGEYWQRKEKQDWSVCPKIFTLEK